MLIYKIFRAEEWEAFEAAGVTNGAQIDLSDGYIHFSTSTQVAETAAKYFIGSDGLMLVAVDDETMDHLLKWEPSRGGALFPHLYRSLHMSDVVWAVPLPLKNGRHDFPQGVLK